MLSDIAFALINAVHASTGFPPFHVNSLTHLRVPLMLSLRSFKLCGGKSAKKIADISPTTMQKQVNDFLATRFSVLRRVRDVMADSQDKKRKR